MNQGNQQKYPDQFLHDGNYHSASIKVQQGGGSSTFMAFETSNTNNFGNSSEQMRIIDNGNVGI